MFFYAGAAFIGGPKMIELCDHNWVGGSLYHGVWAWFGERNVQAEGQRLWPPGKMPDFALPADSPARGKSIDLSKPFTLRGRTYDPLPGMKTGYFSGPAPDVGALQYRLSASGGAPRR